jgi:hypothetical protein
MPRLSWAKWRTHFSLNEYPRKQVIKPMSTALFQKLLVRSEAPSFLWKANIHYRGRNIPTLDISARGGEFHIPRRSPSYQCFTDPSTFRCHLLGWRINIISTFYFLFLLQPNLGQCLLIEIITELFEISLFIFQILPYILYVFIGTSSSSLTTEPFCLQQISRRPQNHVTL